MGAILTISVFASWRLAAALAVAGAAAWPTAAAAAPEPTCLADAGEARAAAVPDPRSLVLEDGRMLRLAGIESFALLLPDADRAEAALQSRMQALLAGQMVQSSFPTKPTATVASRPWWPAWKALWCRKPWRGRES